MYKKYVNKTILKTNIKMCNNLYPVNWGKKREHAMCL